MSSPRAEGQTESMEMHPEDDICADMDVAATCDDEIAAASDGELAAESDDVPEPPSDDEPRGAVAALPADTPSHASGAVDSGGDMLDIAVPKPVSMSSAAAWQDAPPAGRALRSACRHAPAASTADPLCALPHTCTVSKGWPHTLVGWVGLCCTARLPCFLLLLAAVN